MNFEDNKNEIIKVRLLFRLLGILLCSMSLVGLILVLTGEVVVTKLQLLSYVASVIFICPIILISCLLGRLPFFITNRLSSETMKDLKSAENLFLESTAKNTIFKFVFLFVVFFFLFIVTAD